MEEDNPYQMLILLGNTDLGSPFSLLPIEILLMISIHCNFDWNIKKDLISFNEIFIPYILEKIYKVKELQLNRVPFQKEKGKFYWSRCVKPLTTQYQILLSYTNISGERVDIYFGIYSFGETTYMRITYSPRYIEKFLKSRIELDSFFNELFNEEIQDKRKIFEHQHYYPTQSNIKKAVIVNTKDHSCYCPKCSSRQKLNNFYFIREWVNIYIQYIYYMHQNDRTNPYCYRCWFLNKKCLKCYYPIGEVKYYPKHLKMESAKPHICQECYMK